jgi:cytochrome c oxidase cbb3-type subunit I/II
MSTETLRYDDATVRKFVTATIVWGAVGMVVGLWIALQLALPSLNFAPYFTFGRLRPLHTNAVIFAFAGNAIFAAVYYSSQRLLKARPIEVLSKIHFWGWQLIIVAAAITLPLGFTQGKEYAELEWPIDLAIAVVWVTFGVNFFAMVRNRREKHLYVALWFYIATIVTVAILHIFNSLAIPAGAFKSYSLYAGVQDAFMQWWYGHNAVAFFLTTPFLGLMYYFLPKAAGRPVFSYRLSILHFWSLVFIYIWAGPHHLHYTALPAWASSLGMVFSVMLWMPSWGGMINGLLTLRGAWGKVAEEPVLKFFVVAITFYGMSTFEGPMLSIKSVNALSHYTDWNIAHVHGGALGWVGFMTWGMIYWLVPRLYQTKLYSKKLATTHFWVATVGIVVYVVAMWAAGITQGLMWRAFDTTGRLQYPDFLEVVTRIMPMYWVRALGGALYISGVAVGAYNIYKTWQTRPKTYAEVEVEVPPMIRVKAPTTEAGGHWHRKFEGLPMVFTVLVAVAVIVASLFEILPTFLIGDNIPHIKTVKPYTPLELYGRDIYLREGCYGCHSQMLRPFVDETVRYGQRGVPAEYSMPGESVYDHPFQWGSKRTGPDLAREGGRRDELWHLRHMQNPRSTSPGSVMPSYPHLLTDDIPWDVLQKRVDVMAMLGVPYDASALADAPKLAHDQATAVAAKLTSLGGPPLPTKEIIALIAYLQRLGADIRLEKDVVDDSYPVTSATSACAAPTAPRTTLATLRAYLDGAVLSGEPTAPPPPQDDALLARGVEVYGIHCVACHGPKGEGNGPLATTLLEAPAVLTTRTYELRTTEHEALPTDTDLFRTITHGIHGTGMPPWFALSERDRWALVAFVKKVSQPFSEDSAPPPIDIGEVPAITPERVKHGHAIFQSGGCASCHGDLGRGDGPAAGALRYANGQPARPRDLALPHYHRGNRLPELYMTLVAGLDGTPMGSFAKVLSHDDLWDVVMYVNSIGPRYVDQPNGLRCPDKGNPSPDELIGMRSLMHTLHPNN